MMLVSRYIKVGVFNTCITFLAYWVCLTFLELQAGLSYLIAASLATLLNVILHGKITVKENAEANKFPLIFVAYLIANILCFLTIRFTVMMDYSTVSAFFLGVISYQIIYLPSLYIINSNGVGE